MRKVCFALIGVMIASMAVPQPAFAQSATAWDKIERDRKLRTAAAAAAAQQKAAAEAAAKQKAQAGFACTNWKTDPTCVNKRRH